jgi:hypothetical protein
LLVDHGRFFVVPGFPIFIWPFNTIARKRRHDKASRRMPGLNRGAGIAIVFLPAIGGEAESF